MAEVYSYTKVKGIEIGEITNIFYDSHNDVILIVEDKGGRIGIAHHTFGPKADGLSELIDALQSYRQKRNDEFEKEIEKIRKAINS